MKQYFKSLLLQVLAISVGFSGMVFVKPAVAQTEPSPESSSSNSEKLNFQGMPYQVQPDKVTFSYTTLDGDEVQLEVPREKDPGKPSSAFKWVADKVSSGAKRTLKSVAHTTTRFPSESLAFSLAIGALTMGQLAFDESANPVSMMQHVMAQKDPLTHISFFGFMLANSAVSDAMMATISSQRLAPFIPYFGMTAGMMASNMIHELAALPHAWTCAAEMKGTFVSGKAAKPGKDGRTECQKFEDFWSKMNFWDTFHMYCPMFMSMFASTFVSGVLQIQIGKALVTGGSGMMKFVRAATVAGNLNATAKGGRAGKIILQGVELVATSVGPGSWFRWGLRGVGKLTQIAVFMGLDMYFFQAPFINSYTTFDLGGKFNRINRDLMTGLIESTRTQWDPLLDTECHYRDKVPVEDDAGISEEFRGRILKDRALHGVARNLRCLSKLEKALRDLNNNMAKWQDFLLRDVMMSQSTWEEKLGKISAQYLSTKNFYAYFTGALWDAEYNHEEKDVLQTIEMSMPLNGIKPNEIDLSKHPNAWLNQADEIIAAQMETVSKVADDYRKMQTTPTAEYKALTPQQKSFFAEMVSDLGSKDPVKIGKAMERLSDLFRTSQFRGQSNLPKNYFDLLTVLKTRLGNPKPLWAKGEGFALLYYNVADNNSALNAAHFPVALSGVSTVNPVEFLLMSMLKGPEAEDNASLISMSTGWSDSFTPPRIVRKDFTLIPNIQRTTFNKSIFNLGMWADPTITSFNSPSYAYRPTNNKVLQYPSMYSFLLQPNAYRSNVMNADPKVASISKWWNQFVEPQFIKAWATYENKYQENINKLVKTIWRKDVSLLSNGPTDQKKDSRFNPSEVSNSLMTAFAQERKVYLTMLGEIYKDVWAKQNPGVAFPEDRLAPGTYKVSAKGLSTEPKAKLDYVAQWGCVASPGMSGHVGNSDALGCLNDVTAAPETFPILGMVRRNDLMDFKAWTTPFEYLNPEAAGKGALIVKTQMFSKIFKREPVFRNVFFQQSILNVYKNLEATIAKIQPIKVTAAGGNLLATISPISNEEIQAAYKAVSIELLQLRMIFKIRNSRVYKTQDELKEQNQEEMSDWSDVSQQLAAYGVDSNEYKEQLAIELTPHQMAVAKQAYEGLRRQAMNLKMIGLTANTVSYREKTGSDYVVLSRCEKNPKEIGCAPKFYIREGLLSDQ